MELDLDKKQTNTINRLTQKGTSFPKTSPNYSNAGLVNKNTVCSRQNKYLFQLPHYYTGYLAVHVRLLLPPLFRLGRINNNNDLLGIVFLYN